MVDGPRAVPIRRRRRCHAGGCGLRLRTGEGAGPADRGRARPSSAHRQRATSSACGEHMRSLDLGDATFENVPAVVGDVNVPGFVGFVGMRLFNGSVLTLQFPRQRLLVQPGPARRERRRRHLRRPLHRRPPHGAARLAPARPAAHAPRAARHRLERRRRPAAVAPQRTLHRPLLPRHREGNDPRRRPSRSTWCCSAGRCDSIATRSSRRSSDSGPVPRASAPTRCGIST